MADLRIFSFMLTESHKTEIRTRFAAISAAMPNFHPRPAQRVMIAEVAKTLSKCPDPGMNEAPAPGSTVLVVQGGTGTGKSLSYGVAGMIMAKSKVKKLVISTSSVALQHQLVHDLPFFMRASGIEGKIELAKGRTRFICSLRLTQSITEMSQASMFPHSKRADGIDPEDIRLEVEAMAKEYADGVWDGDRDTRKEVTDDVWRTLTTDRHACLNRACLYFKSCAQMKARSRIKEADIVVANHDLVLADLAMGGGKILPAPEDAFIVFDEAHFLPEKAVNVFASNHFVAAERRSADKLVTLVPTIADALGYGFENLPSSIADEASQLSGYLGDIQSYFSGLSQLIPCETVSRPTLEFEESCIPEEFFDIGENIKSTSARLADLLGQVQEVGGEILKSDHTKQALLEKLLSDIGFHAGRADAVCATWSLFLAEPKHDMPPVAKWIEAVKLNKSVDYQLHASPVVAAGYLKSLLWDKAAGVILTSATMSSMGSFDDFLHRSGLKVYGDLVTVLELPSPFNYEAQGSIVIPKFPSPKNYELHTDALINQVVNDINSMDKPEGMLVLFTSKRKLNDVSAGLPEAMKSLVLIQGCQSKDGILKAHKARIDSGSPSVIFGLQSFSVGVDLPGKYCVHVLITQLPFSVPDNPVLRALSAWISKKGRNPFMEISVPDAARKLEQAVGRLIRTENCYGKVTVTDPRLWDSRYGRSILRGLPPFRIVAKGKVV